MVILLLKLPAPVPSLVLVLSAVVGFCEVPHTTPLAVTAAPPSELMFPPPVAPLPVIPLTAVVVSVGVVAVVVKDIWLPYAVPAELVAYPLA